MTINHGYIVHSAENREEMLASMGLKSIEDLLTEIPKELRLTRPLSLAKHMSEWELDAHMRKLANGNVNLHQVNSFLGAGMYQHHIPAVVDAIAQRGEFLTSYTPYQPEMSQGLLQVLSEYQAFMGAITGLPVVNSSSYDGATALAEAIWIGCLAVPEMNVKVAMAEHIWCQSKEVVATYMQGRDVSLVSVKSCEKSGQIDLVALREFFSLEAPSILVLQSPNSVGVIEQLDKIVSICHEFNVTSVLSYHPMMSGLLTPPGLLGIDIVCGEGQPFGIPLSGGGPSLGILACKTRFKPFIAGRLIGEAPDMYGNQAYALVNEEREQHVAREKATSNICSNQALCALRAAVYLSTLGDSGLKELAHINLSHAHYLAQKLSQIKGVSLTYSGDYFNEFCLTLPCDAQALIDLMRLGNVLAGTLVKNQTQQILVAVTEVKTIAQMDDMAKLFAATVTALTGNSKI